ncbi:hypothetical protein ACTFQN_21255 [Bacillus cereus group sp. MYBK30-1]|uniref:hypothetical protein n=1 Tax=unclassified Bacillus cereus group TaxID=2750818 RepID=UPI003F7A9C1D
MDSIQGKLDLLHNEIKEMGDIINLDWCGKLLYTYYEHFNDNNLRYRAGSLIAFLGLLLEWEDESGFPFYTGTEEYDCHHFDKYLEEFLKYSSDIKKQYPNIYLVTVESLIQLDKRENWESEFPNIPSGLFDTVRKKLFRNDVKKLNDETYQKALKEAGMLY